MSELPPPNAEQLPNVPLWRPMLDNFLQTAPYTMSAAEGFAQATHLLFGFVERGVATDLGEIQEHLHQTNDTFQLTAVPRLEAVKFMFPSFGNVLIITDPVTNEPKTHGLAFSFDASVSPLASYLAMQRRNHERNVKNLRENTGRFKLPPNL